MTTMSAVAVGLVDELGRDAEEALEGRDGDRHRRLGAL
jgi:hypothetical protein